MSLTGLSGADPGEAAARAVVDGPIPARPPASPDVPVSLAQPATAQPPGPEGVLAPVGFSFALLWPEAEQPTVRELESALARSEAARALLSSEQLLSRTLASAASLLGSNADSPRDPAVVALLLGIDGRRYLEFRASVRDARAGRPIEIAAALAAFSLVIEARLMRARVG
jgi:hypothetical protein